MAKRTTFEDAERALVEATADPHSDEARAALTAALVGKRALLVARAARIIKEHALDGFEAALADAVVRFMVDGKKADPSCHAKLAALEALDYAESRDAGPFVRAARYHQHEGSDTAAPLRQRAILGLARIGDPDFELVAARLLADREPPVRQAALEALAHRGDRTGAPLALYKLRLGDDDPVVVMAAMTTLLALAPDAALVELRERLDDEDARELAAMALGQSRRADALDVLVEALARAATKDERAPLLTAMGLHRSDRALDALVEVVAEGSAADAEAALEALAVRRFEPGVGKRVRDAAAANDRADLTRRAKALFTD